MWLWLVASVFLVSLMTQAGWTQDGAERAAFGVRSFDIPRQPLASALESYSRATGYEVLYESGIVVALQSVEVRGTFTAEQALGVLLGDTDLRVRFTRRDAITLTLPSNAYDLPPSDPFADADLALETLRVSGGSERPDEGRLREFSETVQADIESALRKDARTRSGNYRANVKLWLTPSRTVSRAELAQSTGDLQRDSSISEILRGLVLRRLPPANTPQPVRVVIYVRSL